MEDKVLITGGTGFIGSSVKRGLKRFNLKILTIGRNEKEDLQIDLNNPKLQNIICDFLPDVVCHFASGSNIARANEDNKKEFNDTVIGTQSLIKILTTLKSKSTKVIYLSTQAVYGLPKYLPVPENCNTEPVTVYGKNKLEAERIIIQSDLNYSIFRIGSVYGPLQDPGKSGVIAKFINRMKNNQPPIVFNAFETFLDFIYIEDVVSALVRGIQDDSIQREVFNLGSGRPTSLKQVLDILYKYFPSAPPPELQVNAVYPILEQKGLYLNIEKIQTYLKWKCKYNIEEGLKEMMKNIKLTETV